MDFVLESKIEYLNGIIRELESENKTLRSCLKAISKKHGITLAGDVQTILNKPSSNLRINESDSNNENN